MTGAAPSILFRRHLVEAAIGAGAILIFGLPAILLAFFPAWYVALFYGTCSAGFAAIAWAEGVLR